MNPQQLMLLMQQQGGAPQEHPLSRAFGGTPMYGGAPIQPSNMFDLSSLGLGSGSPMGQQIGQVMQGILPGLMGPNFVPGQFSPTQNYFDHRYAVQHAMNRRRTLEMASQADQETYFRMIRGMARMRGIEYDPGGEQEMAARRFASDISSWGPILGDIMPDTFEQMHGRRGSSRMFAANAFEASRYTLDPASGRLGMSAESSGAMSREVYDILYGQGADIGRMKGLGAGRAGQIYDEMIKRGFGPGVSVDRGESMARLRSELGQSVSDISSPELQKLRRQIGEKYGVAEDDTSADAFKKISSALTDMGRTDPQGLDAALRSFNASRVAKTVENMAGAVSAMRDIFGDMGRPNAPMVELINGLQSLTQGGLSYMTPQQLENSVRQTYALAKYTGLGLEGIMGFAGTAAQVLDQQGMSRTLAPQIAQGSAAFGFAYGISGQPRAFGMPDREMASQLDIRLRAQAANSVQAGRLASVMRFADEFQRMGPDGRQMTGFDQSTEAYALSQAVRSGQTTYEFGGRRMSIFQAAPRITEILAAAGVNRNDIQASLSMAPAAQAEQIQQYNLDALVREGQPMLDVRPNFSSVFASSATSTLARSKINPRDQGRIAQEVGPAMFDILTELYEEDRDLFNGENKVKLHNIVAARLQARLPALLKDMNTADLANLVSNAMQSAEAFRQSPRSGFAGMPSLRAIFAMNSEKTMKVQRSTIAQTRAITRLQSSLAAVGQEGIAGRLSDFLQTVGEGGGKLQDLAFTALGGIKTEEVAGPIQALFNRIAALSAEFDKGGDKFQQDLILEEIERLGKDVGTLFESNTLAEGMKGLSPEARKLVEEFNKNKPKAAAPVSPQQQRLNAAQESFRRIRDAALEKRGPVSEAKKKRDEAASNLRAVRERLAGTRDTPAVKAARDKLNEIRDRRMDIDKRIAEAEGRGDKAEVARLRKEREGIAQQEQKAAEAFFRASRAVESTSSVQGMRKQEQEAEKALGEAQRNLRDEITKALPDVSKEKDVEDAQKALDKAKADMPKEPGAAGVATTKAQQDVKVTGATVNVSSPNINLAGVPRVEIQARELHLDGRALAVVANRGGDQPDNGTGVNEQRISGVLRIEGLDRALLEARGSGSAADARGQNG